VNAEKSMVFKRSEYLTAEHDSTPITTKRRSLVLPSERKRMTEWLRSRGLMTTRRRASA
jgi:hypothetical protein